MGDTEYSAVYDRLSGKPDDELYVVVGAGTLMPDEYLAAAVATWAPEEVASDLGADGLLGPRSAVDLVARGKEFVERIYADRNQALRDKVCPAYAMQQERDLIIGISPLISDIYLQNAGVLDPAGAVVVAIGFLLLRYGLGKLCEGYSPSGPADA